MEFRIIATVAMGIFLSMSANGQDISNVQTDLVIISEIHMVNLQKRIEIAEKAADKAEDVRKNARKEERKAERKLRDLEYLFEDIKKSKEEITEAREKIKELELALTNGTTSNDLSTKDVIDIREDILDEKKDILKEQEKLRRLANDLN